MPVYVYLNKDGERVEVLRSFDDYQVGPTEEECKGIKGPFTKSIGENIKVIKGENWGYGSKGHWILLIVGGLLRGLYSGGL